MTIAFLSRVAEGENERYIVTLDRFRQKVEAKRTQQEEKR